MGSLFKSKPVQSTSTSTSKTEMYQQDSFDKLLSGASEWLAQGGLQGAPDYTGALGNLLASQGKNYNNIINGTADREALQNSLQMQTDMANKQLARGTMRNIGLSTVGAGNANSSRRSIAEGIAIGNTNAALAQQHANTINNFEQQQIQNQLNAQQGMANLFQQGAALEGMAIANSDQGRLLESLLGYQGLISGNMGATQTGTGTGTQSGGGPSLGQSILGGISTGVGLLRSDKRLKKKIKKTGRKTKDGIDEATWEWNKKAEEEYGLKGKAKGVIAQEAEKVRPDAVVKDKKGVRSVKYGALM